MSRLVEIRVTGSLDLEAMPSFVETLRPVIAACDDGTPFELTVDMRQLEFITPACLGLLSAALLHGCRHTCRRLSLQPSRVDTVDEYLKRMDFYKLLDVPATSVWRRHSSSGRFKELAEVSSAEELTQAVSDIMDIFTAQTEITPETVGVAQNALFELVENVFHHAQSPVNAIVCVQTFPSKGLVELAIVDTGRGFRRSLHENPELRPRCRTAADAVQLAVSPRVTSRPDANAGEGLFFTREMVKENEGAMTIVSEDAAWVVAGRRERVVASPWWQGAAVAVRLNTDRRIGPKAVFDRYAPPEVDFEFTL